MAVIDEPILTLQLESPGEFAPTDDAVYLYGESNEARSQHVATWSGDIGKEALVSICSSEVSSSHITVSAQTVHKDIPLRSERSLVAMWDGIGAKRAYLDITGLPHPIWAPLLRTGIQCLDELYIVYVEPGSYAFSATPTEGQIFDLSERIEGIRPLPGFASLATVNRDRFLFVPLLGFEGTRFSFVMEQVQPAYDRIVPVVGVPGFRAEYPFHTYAGNRRPLAETKSWQRIEYAAANCPFDAFHLLQRLAERYPTETLKIALIGTKPHAVGAVLFSVVTDHPTEILYDHPVRKEGRTTSTGRMLIYNVSAIARSAHERT